MDDEKQEIIPPTIQETDEMWKRLLVDIRNHEREKRRKRIIGAVSGLAAVLILIGGLLTYQFHTSPDVYVANSSSRTIELADHSKITLLKGAKLTVEKSFPSSTRDVFLEGDAIFRVTKSKEHPFIVHGNGYATKVLGTVFKVSQQGKTFTVDLYEGKVQVNKNGTSEKPLILQPKETFSNMGSAEIAAVMKTEGKNRLVRSNIKMIGIHFKECPIPIAIHTLERNFGLKVSYPLELNNGFVSVVSDDADAIDVIKAIALQLNLNIKQINDTTFELER